MQDIVKIRKGGSRDADSRTRAEGQAATRSAETDQIVRQVFARPDEGEKIARPVRGTPWKLLAAALAVLAAALAVSAATGKISVLNRAKQLPSKPLAEAPLIVSQPLFDANAMYGVRLTDGTLYFARVEEAVQEHYKLRDVFYPGSATSTATATPHKIILMKFGTEDYQPQDELLVPREKVKEIFPLEKTSAILKAIKEYLGE